MCGAGCCVALVVAIMYFNCFYIFYVHYFFVFDKSDIRADDASLIIMLFFGFFFTMARSKGLTL